MHSNSKTGSTLFKLLTSVFAVIVLFAILSEACGGEYQHLPIKRDTHDSFKSTTVASPHHRQHFRNHQKSFKHSRRSPLIRKRCRYSETEAKEHFNRDLSKNSEDYQQYNYVKHHHIRDGQQSPYNLNPLTGHETNNIDQTETESFFVNIGERINLTCNINTREIDWHFKDTNLTTTILSYGLQLQVRQPVIHESRPEYKGHAHNIENYHFQDIGFDKRSGQVLKYELSSDFESRHQLSLFIEGTKDEGSYQCVDSQSETPVKKTIHVILSKLDSKMFVVVIALFKCFILIFVESNSGALMSGVESMRISRICLFFLIIFPLVRFDSLLI